MRKSLKLLQVEDSESDASLMIRLLENAGYEVNATRVETGPKMRAALQQAAWDAIVADYYLPQFDAPSALAVLRESRQDIPFIVVSGAVGEDRAVEMMKAGAHDYVMKGNLARLVPAIEREVHEAAVRRERRMAHECLRAARLEAERSHQVLDAVFAAQVDCLVVCNRAGVVIRANPAYAAMFGFDPAGMALADIIERIGLPAGPGGSATERALAGEKVVNLEQVKGDRILERSSLPIRDEAGEIMGAVTIIRDITEKKRAEKRLRQAEQMESVGLLAGGIAHDFNNLLTGISGYISLALERSCARCAEASTLPAALECAERAAQLTRQLLAYAGKGAFVRKPVFISRVARQVLATVEASKPERIRLVTDLSPDLPAIAMDPGQIEQVFSNLILNGVEAIPPGEPGTVTVRTALEGECISIEVSDTGCGIGAEMQDKIFDPFFSTKFPGRGLGLAAVAGIARSLRARIDVQSATGRGTCIRVALPIPKGEQPSTTAQTEAAFTRVYGTVLIVDDEPMVRKVAGAFLRKRGIPVLEAANGKEAIERLSADGGSVRAVLLDVAMPVMSGDAAVSIIRKLRPDVQVIVSSGYHEDDIKKHFDEIEACSYLPKPYTSEQLLAEVMPAVSRCEKAV